MLLRLDAAGQCRCLLRIETEPVHPGIDVDGGAAVPVARGAEAIPFRQFDHAADHRPRIDVRIGRRRSGQQAVEDVDRRLRGNGAHLPRLGEIGDKKGAAAGGGKCPRHRLEPAAIGVRLDHGGAFDRRRLGIEDAPIGDDCRKIDASAPSRCRPQARRPAPAQGLLQRTRRSRTCGQPIGRMTAPVWPGAGAPVKR